MIQRCSSGTRVKLNMAPVRSTSGGMGRRERGSVGPDRKTRKPLVEKKRRARINESLQELRRLVAEADIKMENAEVLEVTVKRVESILQSREQEVEAANREAHERFAAGYIQCMHDVRTFVSNCPDIEVSVATELLNCLLESIPLNTKDQPQLMVPESEAEIPDWSLNESLFSGVQSPSPSSSSSDDLCSDLDETDSDQSHGSSSNEIDALCLSFSSSKSMWRPW